MSTSTTLLTRPLAGTRPAFRNDEAVSIRPARRGRPPRRSADLISRDMQLQPHLPTRRVNDRDALCALWAEWRLNQPGRTTPAQAAHALHVPEALLLSTLDGAGVTPLRPDLAALLAPLTSWGQCLIEIHHPLGVACLALQAQQLRLEAEQIHISDGPQQIALATSGISHCYLVEGSEHSRYGLHWFDGEGQVIARLHLPVGAALHLALPHLLQFTFGESRRQRVPSLRRAPDLRIETSWCAIDTLCREPASVARIAQQARQALDSVGALQLMLEGRGAALSYHGVVDTISHDPVENGWVPSAGSGCALHLRSSAVTHAFVCVQPEGQPFLRLHGAEHGSIGLLPQLGTDLAWAWIDRLVPERHL